MWSFLPLPPSFNRSYGPFVVDAKLEPSPFTSDGKCSQLLHAETSISQSALCVAMETADGEVIIAMERKQSQNKGEGSMDLMDEDKDFDDDTNTNTDADENREVEKTRDSEEMIKDQTAGRMKRNDRSYRRSSAKWPSRGYLNSRMGRLHPNCLFTATGLISDALYLVKHIRHMCSAHWFHYNEEMDVGTIAKATAQLMAAHRARGKSSAKASSLSNEVERVRPKPPLELKLDFAQDIHEIALSRPFGVHFFLIGLTPRKKFQKYKKGLGLYEVNPSGSISRWTCRAVGRGAETVEELFEAADWLEGEDSRSLSRAKSKDEVPKSSSQKRYDVEEGVNLVCQVMSSALIKDKRLQSMDPYFDISLENLDLKGEEEKKNILEKRRLLLSKLIEIKIIKLDEANCIQVDNYRLNSDKKISEISST